MMEIHPITQDYIIVLEIPISQVSFSQLTWANN